MFRDYLIARLQAFSILFHTCFYELLYQYINRRVLFFFKNFDGIMSIENLMNSRSRLLRWYPIWLRNVRVWRGLLGPALLGNVGEPLLYLFGLGYGLGVFVGQVDGMDYLTFLASGVVCASAVNTARSRLSGTGRPQIQNRRPADRICDQQHDHKP